MGSNNISFYCEEEGHIEYKDLEPNLTYKGVDPYSGLSNKEVMQFKDRVESALICNEEW